MPESQEISVSAVDATGRKTKLILSMDGAIWSPGIEGALSDELITIVGSNNTSGSVRERAAGRFITKCIDEWPLVDEMKPEEVFAKHSELKRRKLPVVNTIRFVPEKKMWIMTDMSEDGTKFVVDKHYKLSDYDLRTDDIRNFEELKHELYLVADRAFEGDGGVVLDYDAYAIIVDKEVGSDGKRGAKVALIDIFAGSRRRSVVDNENRSRYLKSWAKSQVSDFINKVLYC